MLFLLRAWRARYLLELAEWDIRYWESALSTARYNLRRAERRAEALRRLPNDIRFRMPRGVGR
jgi:hypothetical protein